MINVFTRNFLKKKFARPKCVCHLKEKPRVDFILINLFHAVSFEYPLKTLENRGKKIIDATAFQDGNQYFGFGHIY